MLINIGDRFSSHGKSFLRSLILLTFEGMNFHIKLEFATLKLIDGLGSGFSRDANAREYTSMKNSMIVIA